MLRVSTLASTKCLLERGEVVGSFRPVSLGAIGGSRFIAPTSRCFCAMSLFWLLSIIILQLASYLKSGLEVMQSLKRETRWVSSRANP